MYVCVQCWCGMCFVFYVVCSMVGGWEGGRDYTEVALSPSLPVPTRPDIMDLDVQAVPGSLGQLQLSEKPQLSLKARQRLSVKRKKTLSPASKSSPLAERRSEGEGERRVGESRSASPPPAGAAAARGRGTGKQDSTDQGRGIQIQWNTLELRTPL